MKSEVQKQDTDDKAPSRSSSVEPKAEPEILVLNSAMRKDCFIRDSSFKNLEAQCKLASGSVLTGKGSPVLDDLP